jgi:hypothetical protein
MIPWVEMTTFGEIEIEKRRLQKTRAGENAEESDNDRKALEVIILKI